MEALAIDPNGIYVDLTMGGFGHSQSILDQLDKGRLIAFDQDADAIKNVPNDERVLFIHANFRYMYRWLRYYNIDKVDGILADLGVSSHQFDVGIRGFSYRFEGPLDMRMDQRSDVTAADLLNKEPESKLADLFYNYGDLSNSRKLARMIVEVRKHQTIQTCEELKHILLKEGFSDDPQFLSKLYQSLRIAVNSEIDALAELLPQCGDCLAPGGRLVIMSYHSLEDRLVKNYLKTGNVDGKYMPDEYGITHLPLKIVNKKPIEASAEEVYQNPRSRSAKLRIGEKI